MTFRMPSWPDHEACMVEVLIVPGCPGAKLAMTRVQEASESLGVRTNLRVLTVDRDEDATKLGFVGSPTIRVDGQDVEDVGERPFGLACRLYDNERAPSSDSIKRAIRAASVRSS